MHKKLSVLFLIIVILSITLLLRTSLGIYSTQRTTTSETKPDNKFFIAHTEIFGKLERPQVLFNHSLHAEKFEKEGCNTCHYIDSDRNLIFDFPFEIVPKNKVSIMDSFHDKCIGCHKKMINEKKKSGPVKCGKCHVKKFAMSSIKYPVVEFDFFYHDKHIKKIEGIQSKRSCGYCHHIYNEELVYEEGTEQSCYYCHDQQKKRGPSLSIETDITYRKGLTVRKISHKQCINCHLLFKKEKKEEKACPIVCSECHTGKYKSIAELIEIQRPERGQPEKADISIEGGMMKSVLFDHASHEKNSKTCRSCHHETLKACKECHNLTGKTDGKWIKIADAYHNIFSERSCTGCHNKKKFKGECAGCHHHLLDIELQTRGPKRDICYSCHSGKREKFPVIRPIDITQISIEKIPEKVTVEVLEKEYKPAIFPHWKIIKKLIEVSNESKMATYFHGNIQTICKGCHHQSLAEAEAKKNKPPFCRNCHSINLDFRNIKRPRLLAAYHRQCIGCHEKMNIDAMECKDCHEEKRKG